MKDLGIDFEDMPEQWEKFNMAPDINQINDMIQKIPKNHTGFSGRFEVMDNSLRVRDMQGVMNLPIL